MRNRLIVAWMEMIAATVIAGTLLAIDFIRQHLYAGLADVLVSLSFTAVVAMSLVFASGARLRRTLDGVADPRPAPPTAVSIVGVSVVGLAVLLAMAPALIQL